MCLLGGGDSGMFESRVPVSQSAKTQKQRLYYLMAAHGVVTLLLLIGNPLVGIMEMFGILILWCATSQMNFCIVLMYMFLCFIGFINML